MEKFENGELAQQFEVGDKVTWSQNFDPTAAEISEEKYGNGPFEVIKMEKRCYCHGEHHDINQCPSPYTESISVKNTDGKTFKRDTRLFKKV